MLAFLILNVIVLAIIVFLSSVAIAYTSILDFKLTLRFFSGFFMYLMPGGKQELRQIMADTLNSHIKKRLQEISGLSDKDVMRLYKLDSRNDAKDIKENASGILNSFKKQSLVTTSDAQKFMEENNMWGLISFFYSYLSFFSDVDNQHSILKDQTPVKLSEKQQRARYVIATRRKRTRKVENLFSGFVVENKSLFNLSNQLKQFAVPS